ncbi:MAG: hypothetical protein ACI8PZ_007128 [Myxococcota bacterium]|jgi:hypothetical protein
MSSTISFSHRPDRVWMVKNALYRWFVSVALEHTSSPEVRQALEMSELVNGLVIDIQSDPGAFNVELVGAIRSAADDIRNRAKDIPRSVGSQGAVTQRTVVAKFADLVSMLGGLRPGAVRGQG